MVNLNERQINVNTAVVIRRRPINRFAELRVDHSIKKKTN